MFLKLHDQVHEEVNASSLKEMQVHERVSLGEVEVLRVWAGWIYYNFQDGKETSAIFVPQPQQPTAHDSEQLGTVRR